ncbi:MAG: DUF945 family protein [Woeseia sp.]
MKRWMLLGLLALAVLLLISPGIVGHLAERAIEKQIDFAEARDPQLAVDTTRFERGWFTSAGQFRVPIIDPELAELELAMSGSAAEAGVTPVLLIDTRLDHGLLPFGAIGRDAGSLLPAIASGLSTLRLELAPGRTVELPGKLVSRLGINGTARFHYELPADRREANGIAASWSSADIYVSSSTDGSALRADATLVDWSIDLGDEALSFARLTSVTDIVMSEWGIAVGSFDLELTDTRIRQATGSELRWSMLTANAESALNDDLFNGSLRLSVADLNGVRGKQNVHLQASVSQLQARFLRPVLRRMSAVAADPSALNDIAYAQADEELRLLLSAGSKLSIDELHVETDDGVVAALISLEVPATDRMRSWPGLLLALDGKADVELPVDLVGAMPDLALQLQPLIATGFLRRDGDNYVLHAAYAKGLATINGAPMPIPLLGSQDD